MLSGDLSRTPAWMLRRSVRALTDLRLQVVLKTDLADQLDLGFQEVDVLFGVVQDRLQQIAGHVVAHGFAVSNAACPGLANWAGHPA